MKTLAPPTSARVGLIVQVVTMEREKDRKGSGEGISLFLREAKTHKA